MGEVVVLRQVSHPARAIEVDLRLEDGCGRALPANYAFCLDAPEARLAPRRYEGTSTLLLVPDPASDEERRILADAIGQFAAARPASERIAVHRWGAALTQIADFTADRGRLATLTATGLDRKSVV